MMLILLTLAAAFCLPAQVRFVSRQVTVPGKQSGALMVGQTLYSWGDGLSKTTLQGRVQPMRSEKFGAAGCAGDIDRDGSDDLVLHALPGKMVWLKGPQFQAMQVIDTGADFADCRVTKISGRRGVLITHRGMQLRVYEPLSKAYREIYSFYTASYQSGLLEHDVDGDGRTDLLAGNYWVQAPASFELPWRLFAINTYNDTPHAAHVKMALLRVGGKPALIVSQGELHPAKLAMFAPPADPKQLWTETRLDGDLDLNEPAALASGDVDGDGLEDFVTGERGGSKPRVMWWRQQRDGTFRSSVIHQGTAAQALFLTDINHDGKLDVIVTGVASIVWLESRSVK